MEKFRLNNLLSHKYNYVNVESEKYFKCKKSVSKGVKVEYRLPNTITPREDKIVAI